MRISDQDLNRLRVLKAIRRAEPVARTELAALTGLTKGAITQITGELVRRAVLIEEKTAAGGKGRPRIALHINPDAAYVISASLLPAGNVTVDLTNANGDQLFEKVVPFPRTPTVEALAALIADVIDDAIAASPVPRSAMHSVGLALPGLVDAQNGTLLWMPTYPPEPVPIAALLRHRLRLPVYVDDGFSVFARGEHWFGEDCEAEDSTFILFDANIGLAQLENGLIRSGPGGLGAAFGHVRAPFPDGRPCLCGAKDCLDAHAGVFSIVSEAQRLRGGDLPTNENYRELCKRYVREAETGDQEITAIFERAGRSLGVAVANYVNTCNPRQILICTSEPEAANLVRPAFEAALDEVALPMLREGVAVDWRQHPAIRHRKGAAALVLEQLYRAPPRKRPGRPVKLKAAGPTASAA